MKTTVLSYLVLALLVGCSSAPTEERFDASGYFVLNNGTNTVFWCTLDSANHTDIQYVLLVPQVDEVTGSGKTYGELSYNQDSFRMTRNGHRWLVESRGNLNSGIGLLRLSDTTAETVMQADLTRSRFWRLADEGTLIPLDKIDPTITNRVVNESQTSTKRILDLRKKT